MNKFLVISILTLIIVGANPVSAWSPFEHSSKDWDWKDWTFLGVSVGVGLAAIAGSFYYMYRAYQNHKITIASENKMAARWIKQNPDWTQNDLDINHYTGSLLEPEISKGGVTSLFGIHTITFEDGSQASIFHDLIKEFDKIDAVLKDIYGEGAGAVRMIASQTRQPLVTVNEYIEHTVIDPITSQVKVITHDTSIDSIIHGSLPFEEGMPMSGIVKETFTFRNRIGTSAPDMFGNSFSQHSLGKSVFVTYNAFRDNIHNELVFSNQELRQHKFFYFQRV